MQMIALTLWQTRQQRSSLILTLRNTSVVADFFTDNKLKVNEDKTHLLGTPTRQKRKFVDTSRARIHTPSASINPSGSERILDAEVHQNMKWASHIWQVMTHWLNLWLGGQVHSRKSKTYLHSKQGRWFHVKAHLSLREGCEDYLVNHHITSTLPQKCYWRLVNGYGYLWGNC